MTRICSIGVALGILGFVGPIWAQDPMATSGTTRRNSFRPTPLRGESQLEGRRLDPRAGRYPPRIILLPTGGASTPAVSAAEIRARAQASRARLRAAAMASARLAMLSTRRTPSAASHGVAHVLTLEDRRRLPAPEYDERAQSKRDEWIENATARMGLRDFRASFHDGTVVLEGTVSSEEEARMAERLFSLEPSVHSIDNRLILQPDDPPAATAQ